MLLCRPGGARSRCNAAWLGALVLASCAMFAASAATSGTPFTPPPLTKQWSHPTGFPQQPAGVSMLFIENPTGGGVMVVSYPTTSQTTGASVQHVLGLDASTGAVAWTGNGSLAGDGGLAYSPTTNTFAMFNTAMVTMVDPGTGHSLWQGKLNYQAWSGFADGVLVAANQAGSTQYNTLGYDAKSGKMLYNLSSFSVSGESVVGGSSYGLVLSFFQGGLALIDPHTGKFIDQKFNLNGGYVQELVGRLLVACNTGYGANHAVLSAQDVVTGKTVWTTDVPAGHGVCNVSTQGFAVTKQAALSRDSQTLFVATNSPPAILAVRVADGSILWTTAILDVVPGAEGADAGYNHWGYPCATEDWVVVWEQQVQGSGFANVKRVSAFSTATGALVGSTYFENTQYPQALPVCSADAVFLYGRGPSTFGRPDAVQKFVLG